MLCHSMTSAIYCRACLASQRRFFSLSSVKMSMRAWQLNSYQGIDTLTLNPEAKKPSITSPDDVLIQVHATSLNPIDLRMSEGYGRTVLNAWRQTANWDKACAYSEFPLTLGRDCSGVVVAVGRNVKTLKPGTEVYSAVPSTYQGCQAEYVLSEESASAKKPATLSHVQAAAIPYAALTAYNAICKVGELTSHNSRGKEVLVVGGSGGVGQFSICMLKAWGAVVTATCNHDAVDMLLELGTDRVIDYSSGDIYHQVADTSTKYDLVLDLVSQQAEKTLSVLKPWSVAKYVMVNTPLLQNADSLGLLAGLGKSAWAALYDTFYGLQVGGSYRWAFFQPDATALTELGELADRGLLVPRVEEVYGFDEVSKAFTRLTRKHMRGKLVVKVVEEMAE